MQRAPLRGGCLSRALQGDTATTAVVIPIRVLFLWRNRSAPASRSLSHEGGCFVVPGALHGLSVALRWPGVRAILNAADQPRQRGEEEGEAV
jgi:hypothetical protein